MFDSLNEYLKSFKNKLDKNFGDSFSVDSLKDKIENHRFSLTATKREIDAKRNEYRWVNKLNLVIEKIMSIASNPRSHIKSYKSVKNIDVAPKIDNKDIAETIKVPKFWRPFNGEMLPDKVYCDNHDIELAIYENRFIVSLIELLNFFLMQSIQELYSKVKFIKKNYSSNKMQIGLIANNKDKSLLTLNNEPYALLLKKIIDYKKKLSLVFSSYFYKEVKKSKPLAYTDIHATNMLLEDPAYSICFNFYRKYLTSYHKNEKIFKKNKIIYHDYALMSLLIELDKFGFTFEDEMISIDDLFIKQEYIHGKNKDFNVLIEKNENQILLTFTYRFLDIVNGKEEKFNQKYTSKICLDIIPTYPAGVADDDEMNKIFEDKINIKINEGYDNSYVLTAIEMQTSNNVIFVSPLNKKLDSNLSNLIKSVLLTIKGDKYIYSHLCPVCGSHIIPTKQDGECVCPMCSSRYSLFDKKRRNKNLTLIWIKKVNNKPLIN